MDAVDVDVTVTPEGRRYILIGVAVLLVVAGGAFVAFQSGSDLVPTGPSGEEGANQTDEFEQYASADEKSGTTDTQGATVGATININEFGVTPARATIQVGEAVKWVNERDVPVRLEFDRTPQTPTIQPGASLEMRFRAVTYYDVYNAETDEEITGGSIAPE